MSTVKMTILGMEQYQNERFKKSIFKDLIVPEGIDRDLLINNILIKAADFEVLYSEPNFLTQAIGVWSKKSYRTFDKWVKALALEYDPISNYDRKEETSDEYVESSKGKTNSTVTGGATNNSTNSSYPFNNDTAHPTDSLTSRIDNSDSSEASNEENGSHSNIHKSRVSGNVGVTTSQQMLESELSLARFNLIDNITDLFIQEFCLLIY